MTTAHLPFWWPHFICENRRRTFYAGRRFSDIEALFTADSDELATAGLNKLNIAALKTTNWNAVANRFILE